MNKYKFFSSLIVIFEISILLLCNVLYYKLDVSNSSREYRIEAMRVANELQTKSITEIDLAKYNSIISISEYKPDDICNDDYVIYKVNDTLYRITYKITFTNYSLIVTNISLTLMIICTVIILIYIQRKILCPFNNMSRLTEELAKGNLSMPIKEEKSKLFGRFLWGMDMLREKLEANKKKELEFQKEKKTLLLSLSHDIKTPLSAIDLYVRALSYNLYETEDKRCEVLDGIVRNLDEIKHYINEITKASREDFLNLTVNNEEFYFSTVVSSITSYYKDKLQLLHTSLTLSPFCDCLLIGDKERVIEILQNVMENAIKYGDGKEIIINFTEEEDCKLMQITNTGNTLAKDELQNIFDSFYRGSNSQKVKGSGLGLYIAKSLMNKMDGDIFASLEDNLFSITVVLRKA